MENKPDGYFQKKKDTIKERIAELISHGMDSYDIDKDISPCTTKTLVSIITDYMEADLESHWKEANGLLEKVANSYEDTGCDDCGTVSKEVINEIRLFLGWKEV
jgi:hypothetical protein